MPKVSSNSVGTVKDITKQINAVTLKGMRRDYRVSGAPGLQLRISANGTATWAVAYKSPRTLTWAKVAIGRYPAVTLKEAKGRASEVAANVRNGKDPIHDKRQEALVETFAVLASR